MPTSPGAKRHWPIKRPTTVAHVSLRPRQHNDRPHRDARLQFAEATAFNDPAGRTDALRRIVAADPSNIKAVQALGDEELAGTSLRRIRRSLFGRRASPARPGLLNLQAYALMFAGDEKGALEAVHEYQKAVRRIPMAWIQKAISSIFGHFADAEKLYLASAAKDPQFNQGAETLEGRARASENRRCSRGHRRSLTATVRTAKKPMIPASLSARPSGNTSPAIARAAWQL